MTAPASTRERLVTEALKLFSSKGFEATSVSQIEAAAGLAAGSGALYRHFKSKNALLDAGIDRQLDRRRAMRAATCSVSSTTRSNYYRSPPERRQGNRPVLTPPTPRSSTDLTRNSLIGSAPGRQR
jgi:hypothetical protein